MVLNFIPSLIKQRKGIKVLCGFYSMCKVSKKNENDRKLHLINTSFR